MSTLDVQPGDWFVVDPSGTEQIFYWVELGERLIDGRRAKGKRWGHSGVASRWAEEYDLEKPSPVPVRRTLMVVEAEPGGAVERPWRWENAPHLWSTGTGLSVPSMAVHAQQYAGLRGPGLVRIPGLAVGYAFEDYVAIAAHRYRMHPFDNVLKDRIASSGHMICSQLTDQCAQDSGIHLFNDGRWPGYVTPLDLGLLLGG